MAICIDSVDFLKSLHNMGPYVGSEHDALRPRFLLTEAAEGRFQPQPGLPL